MPTYANQTSVSTMKSRDEIERTLVRYGAEQFMHGWDADKAIIAFQANGRRVKFVLPLPSRDDRAFTHTPSTKKRRTPAAAEEAWEQGCRQRWRALALVIKAKLEAVEAGITEFDSEFAMHILLPDGSTVQDHVLPAIDEAYATGSMPHSLLAIGRGGSDV
jgi:hypothetical protein